MSLEIGRSNGASRRERRIQRQRKEIMDAAARLFAEKGYAATTTKDIALAADIGESTLYGYFPGKRDVLIAILSQQAEQVDSLFLQSVNLKDRQDFIDLADSIMEIVLSKVVYTRALIAEAWVNDEILDDYVVSRTNRIIDYLKDFILEKTAAGIFHPIDPGLAARIVVATFIGALLPVLRGMEPPPPPEERKALANAIVSLLLDGIIVRKNS